MLSRFDAPTPPTIPSHQESQNILLIAYDYPCGVTLDARVESLAEYHPERTESLYTAFSRVIIGYPTSVINKSIIERF